MALLSIENISKSFGKHRALKDISLDIEPGEFVSLLGPSGCGKTTLLRLIAGFMSVDKGKISILGDDVTGLPAHRRPLNTVFQNYALFPHMTVAANVAYGPRRAGASRSEARRMAEESLALVGLEEFGERYPRQLSGGQQQRVALARAIVNRPKLLLLDEPLSALDLQLRKRMQIELKQLQEKIGVTFIFVTHDQEEAMAMSDRIAVMNAGRIEQLGTGADIYRRPKTRFVAEFIGEASLLPVKPNNANKLDVVKAEEGDDSAVAVLRPEHVEVFANREEALSQKNMLVLDGHVETIASIGGVTNLYIRALGHLILARRLGLIENGPHEGDKVVIGLRDDYMHLLEESPR